MEEMRLFAFLLAAAAFVIVLVDAFRKGGRDKFLLALLIPIYSLYWLFARMSHKGLVILFLLLSAGGFWLAARIAKEDPCRLLSREEVEEAMGHRVEQMERRNLLQGTVCSFHLAGTQAKLHLLVNDCQRGMLSSLNASGPSVRAFPVGDLGAAARSIGPTLWVQKDETCFVFYWGAKRQPGADLLEWTLDHQFEDTYLSTLAARKSLAQTVLTRYKP